MTVCDGETVDVIEIRIDGLEQITVTVPKDISAFSSREDAHSFRSRIIISTKITDNVDA